MSRWGIQPSTSNRSRIPLELRENYPWVAWDAKPMPSGKIGKIPIQPHTGARASTTNPAHWGTFDEAVARYKEDGLSGIGIVLTGGDLDVGDLDRQIGVDDGSVVALDAVARAYGDTVATYAELSPSGRGMRVISRRRHGEKAVKSFSNHKVGIDLYTGDGGRFVTITGEAINDHGVATGVSLAGLERFRPAGGGEAAAGLPMPDLLEHVDIPAGTPPSVMLWLSTGEKIGNSDGNGSALGAALALYAQGLSDAEVLTVLSHSVGGESVAGAPHRRPGDPVGQADWLWRYVCLKGRSASPDRATEALPTLDAPAAEPESEPDAGRYSFYSMDELAKGLRPPDWLVKPLLEKETLGVLFGATGTRKSFVMIDLFCSIASGTPWHGRYTARGICIYFCGEGQAGVSKRVTAWQREHEATGPVYISKAPANIGSDEGIKQIAEGIVECYRRAKAQYGGGFGIAAVGIDTLSTNSGGLDESSNPDVARMMGGLARIRDAYKCCVIPVHHVGHGATDRERGAYALRANADFSIRCSLTGDDDSPSIGRATVLSAAKTKDGEAWPPISLAASRYVFTGEDEVDAEGEPMTTLLLHEALDSDAAKAASRATQQDQIVTYIAVHPGCLLTEIQDAVGIGRNRMLALIKRLIDDGIIDRRGGARGGLYISTAKKFSAEDYI